ncbi:YdeI/OmpD-associated family protein [Bremerella sp. JC770]|uniref:YdeI/OmpD-associated family protein n=1 Tax=Bremerella sp. JC770 TaxID=3232137 RepID=UPI00345A7028
MNPNVDDYIERHPRWQKELTQLRTLVLASQLTEDWKWRAPCYTLNNKNVVMIAAFKNDCVLSFFKGPLLKDPDSLLTAPGENSRTFRVVRFTDAKQITKLKSKLKFLIDQAIEVERSGKQLEASKGPDEFPAELQTKLQEDPNLKQAFEQLTPGRQRAYVMHFAAAKQSKTRTARIKKFTPRILDGKGMNDCVCGLTQKPPGCDGSHNKK